MSDFKTNLWNATLHLRGRMYGDEYKNYILGLVFFKFLSDNVKWGNSSEIELPKDLLLDAIVKASNPVDQLSKAFALVEAKDAFKGIFEDVDLSSSKLGKTVDERNNVLLSVLKDLQAIDFAAIDKEQDLLGDAYEYLIQQFASDAGKKSGEFYTPQSISKILVRLVCGGRNQIKSAYDPSCGSGSLLLRVAKEFKGGVNVYGQELNRTTYNLARMNMLLHGQSSDSFSIANDNTLTNPAHLDKRFDAIVANPPFSVKWTPTKEMQQDVRFAGYSKLAPKSKADYAFIQHMIYHLAEGGRMAAVLPHGVLFRGAAEGVIRKKIIDDNLLDAVIGLPANIFYGTSIPTCIFLVRKGRQEGEPVLFIDASSDFKKGKKQNDIRPEDADKLVKHYLERKETAKYSYLASLEEIKENDYNLNIPRYVDTFEEEEPVDLNAVAANIKELNRQLKEQEQKLSSYLKELGLATPFNI